MNAYFQGREAQLPAAPAVTESAIRGIVLTSRGSAAGIDGIPYELYHFGATYVTHLLHEALLAASDGVAALND
ncbi:MAG: hypothetical protein ACKPKO_52465, partial [Candidatus Fonsibacter sp.]